MKNKQGFTIASMLNLFSFAVGLTILSPLLLPIAKSFHLSIEHAGLLFTFNFMGLVVFNVVFSLIASRVDLRKSLIVCTLGYIGFLYLFTTATSSKELFIYISLFGGIGGLMQSLSSTAVVKLHKDREGFYFNFSQVFFGFGALFGPLLSGYLNGLGYPWETMFLVTAAIAGFSAVLLIFFKVDGLEREEGLKVKELGVIFRIRDFNFMLLAMLLYVGGEIGVWGWISTLLKLRFDISPLKSGFSVGVFWIFMIIGRITTARLTEELSLKTVLLFLSVGATFFTFLTALSQSELVIWVLLALIGLTYSGLWPTIMAYAGKVSGKYDTSAYFLTIAAGGVGGMTIPYLLGVLGKAVSISITLGTIALMMLFIVIFVLFCRGEKAS